MKKFVQNENYLLDISEYVQDVFNAIRKSNVSDLDFFVTVYNTYDQKEFFKVVNKEYRSTTYEGSIPNKLICGGKRGKIKFVKHDDFESIIFENKDNPFNNYNFSINKKTGDGRLDIESERIYKTISFSVRKHFFGTKIENVKQHIEKIEEPGYY